MNQNNGKQEEKGEMTVEEAGHMGGQKEKELVEKGKEIEGQEPGSQTNQGDNQNNE